MNASIVKTFSAFRLLTYISWVLTIAFVSNCYFNPAIQSVINPLESKSSSAGVLALLGGGANTSSSNIATLQVGGQLKSDGLNLVNGNLTVSYGSSSVRGVSVSTSTTTNSVGRFILSLKPGTPKISVTDANGNDLGSFELNVPAEGDITEKSNSSSLTVSNLKRYTVEETPDLTNDDSSVALPFVITSSTPAAGAQLDSSAAPNTAATLNFSLAVDSSTIDSSSVQVINNGSPGNPGTVNSLSVSGTVVTFLMGNLYSAQVFTITLADTIKSTTGSSLPATMVTFEIKSGGK